MRVVSSGTGAEPGYDSESVRVRTAQVEALSEDARAVLTTVRASATSAAAWPAPRDGAAASALLYAVAAVCEAATTALSTRAEELREQATRARATDADTADRLRAIDRSRGDDVPILHRVPVHGGGGNHGAGNRGSGHGGGGSGDGQGGGAHHDGTHGGNRGGRRA